jgi:hypothetical protein
VPVSEADPLEVLLPPPQAESKRGKDTIITTSTKRSKPGLFCLSAITLSVLWVECEIDHFKIVL